MKLTILILAGFALFLGACERHDWEETKALYEHGDHGSDHSKKEKSEEKEAAQH